MIRPFKSRHRPPSDLGDRNSDILRQLAQSYANATFVDLGVRFGYSSEALLSRSTELNNHVYGVDINLSRVPSSVRNHAHWECCVGDSATAGRYWNPLRKVSIVFIDTIHVPEMILTELLMWSRHLEVGGTFVFHDTHWAAGSHETINGKTWGRPEAAVVQFFGLDEHNDFENEAIRVQCFPESYGMTLVTVKQHSNFAWNVRDWSFVLDRRKEIIETYSTLPEIRQLGIDLFADLDVASMSGPQP